MSTSFLEYEAFLIPGLIWEVDGLASASLVGIGGLGVCVLPQNLPHPIPWWVRNPLRRGEVLPSENIWEKKIKKKKPF